MIKGRVFVTDELLRGEQCKVSRAQTSSLRFETARGTPRTIRPAVTHRLRVFQGLRSKLRQESGIILIVVLWVLIILTLLVVGIGRRTSVDVALARFEIGKLKAKYLALSGFMYARAKILEDKDNVDTRAQCGVVLEEGQTLEDIFGRIELEDGYFEIFYSIGKYKTDNHAFLHGCIEDVSRSKMKGELSCSEPGDLSGVQYGLTDEERRINLNALTYNNYKILSHLIVQAGFDEQTAETIASSVIDWRDSDDNNFNDHLGAEESYYSAQESKYHCKNSPFESLEELLLVRGMTEEVFGAIKNDVTFFPQKGSMKINFNTASENVLLALAKNFSGTKTNTTEADAESLAGKMLSYRAGDDTVGDTVGGRVISVNDMGLNAKEKVLFLSMAPYKTEKSQYLRIKVKGVEKATGASALIETVVNRNDLSVVSWRRRL
ncbi:MAG: general secretion pathway protein GspK [Candidatus Omnitrophica bacterium]|nr:general secretion pathway protein GspK [Candidatus Omnitrophota bacterium]